MIAPKLLSRTSQGLSALLSLVILVLSGCSVGAVVTEGPEPVVSTPPSQAVPFETPPGGDVRAVSVSHPSGGAADALAKCQIGGLIPIAEVSGMGEIASASDIVHYVPLTGREPRLREAGPAWIIQIHGDVPQPMSGEVWTDPTCLVTASDSGLYGTGPIRNTSTGAVDTPEPPASLPDRSLPTLAP